MPVDDRRPPDATHLRVDPTHEQVDVVAESPVLFDPLPRGGGHLEKDHVGRVEPALLEQFAHGPDTLPEPFRVVQPVDAEEDHFRVPELLEQGLGLFDDLRGLSQIREALRVDRDGVGTGDTRVARSQLDPVAFNLVFRQPPDQAQVV